MHWMFCINLLCLLYVVKQTDLINVDDQCSMLTLTSTVNVDQLKSAGCNFLLVDIDGRLQAAHFIMPFLNIVSLSVFCLVGEAISSGRQTTNFTYLFVLGLYQKIVLTAIYFVVDPHCNLQEAHGRNEESRWGTCVDISIGNGFPVSLPSWHGWIVVVVIQHHFEEFRL